MYIIMLNTFLSALLLTIISGLAFVAYKHPKGYRNILNTFALPFISFFVIALMFYTISIAVSISSLNEQAVEAEVESYKVSVSIHTIQSMNDKMTKLIWILAVSFGVSLYLFFLYSLPSFLEHNNTPNEDKEGHNIEEMKQDTDKASGTQT